MILFPKSGFRIGRILGIEISINASWILIFILVSITFGSILRNPIEIFPELESYVHQHPIPSGPWVWVAGIVTAGVFFSCLLLHEISHSFVGKRNGVPIKRISLFLFGGVAEMGEDVKDPVTELKMALAGPLATFILSGAFYGLYRLAKSFGAGGLLVVPLIYLSLVNLAIGFFNLLPGFPLDGGRVLRALIWKSTGNLEVATRVGSICGQIVASILVAVGVYSIFIDNLAGGFWLVIIGFFLYRLAQISYRQTTFRLASEGIIASDLLTMRLPEIDAETPLTPLRDYYFAWYKVPAFPVYRGGEPIGVIFRDDLRRVVRSDWDVLNAARLSRPLDAIEVVDTRANLEQLIRSALKGTRVFGVMEGGKIVGVLSSDDILKFIDERIKSARRK